MMAQRPTTAELLRYLEGEMSAKRTNQIENMIDDHPPLAAEVESLRKALLMESDLRNAVWDTVGLETERRIENTLVETVTGVLGTSNNKGEEYEPDY